MKMKYTNKMNYPDYVVQWLTDDSYDHDDSCISATTLMKPSKMFAYERKYPDKLETDVINNIASKFGTAVHDSFEAINKGEGIIGARQEERFHVDMCTPLHTHIRGGIPLPADPSLYNPMIYKGYEVPTKVSGKFDCMIPIDEPVKDALDKCHHDLETDSIVYKPMYKLVDFKTTSVWTMMYGSKDQDYINQLSVYRYLANQNKVKVIDEAEICMIFTDWSRTAARRSEDYPDERIWIKPIKLMSLEDTEKFILENMHRLHEAMVTDPDTLVCEEKDLWSKDSTYEAHNTRTMDVKKFKSKDKADLFVAEKPHIELKEIKGKVNRCDYCSCRSFCNQYKQMKEEGRVE